MGFESAISLSAARQTHFAGRQMTGRAHTGSSSRGHSFPLASIRCLHAVIADGSWRRPDFPHSLAVQWNEASSYLSSGLRPNGRACCARRREVGCGRTVRFCTASLLAQRPLQYVRPAVPPLAPRAALFSLFCKTRTILARLFHLHHANMPAVQPASSENVQDSILTALVA